MVKQKKEGPEKEREFLELLRKLDSVAYRKTRKQKQASTSNGRPVKDFNKAQSELFSKVYISSLKAKLSLLATQLKTE
jgi:hypothetical protein